MAEEEVHNELDMNDDADVNADIGDAEDDQEITLPSKTYLIDNGRILSYIDGLDAMVQAIDKAVNTARMAYDIYSPNYGSDIEDLIGKDRDLAKVEAERMLIEAIEADDRVIDADVTDIYFDEDGNLIIYAVVNTIFGEVNVGQEVS